MSGDREHVVGILADNLRSGRTIRTRLVAALGRVAELGPLTEDKVAGFTLDAIDGTDIMVLRFASLASLLNDQLIRGILLAEGEDLAGTSRRDQRNLAEKIGALGPEIDLQGIANLRNPVSHQYPSNPARQAALLTEPVRSAPTLISAFDGLAAFADRKLLGGTGGLPRGDA